MLVTLAICILYSDRHTLKYAYTYTPLTVIYIHTHISRPLKSGLNANNGPSTVTPYLTT